MSLDDRVTKLETINEVYMKKIVDGLDAVSALKLEAQEAKKFRDEFEQKTQKLVDDKLNTIDYDKNLKKIIQAELATKLHDEKTSEEFTNKVEEIIKKNNKSLLLNIYLKVTAVIVTLIGVIITAYINGVM